MVSISSQVVSPYFTSHQNTSTVFGIRRNNLITPYQDQIFSLTQQNASLGRLSELVQELKSEASLFSSIKGAGVTIKRSTNNASIVSGSATDQAQNGSYKVHVSRPAENAALSFNDRFGTENAVIYSGLNNSAPIAKRTVTLSVGQGSNLEKVVVTLNSTTTLSKFVNVFNAQSEQASASIVNLGTATLPSYGIIISSHDSGVAKGNLAVSVGAAITDSGKGAFTSYTIDQAQNASFTLTRVTGAISPPNEENFSLAQTTNPQQIAAALTGLSDSFAGTNSALDVFTQVNDLFDYGQELTRNQVSILRKQIDKVDSRIADQEQRLQKQYVRLNTLLDKLNLQSRTLSSLNSETGT